MTAELGGTVLGKLLVEVDIYGTGNVPGSEVVTPIGFVQAIAHVQHVEALAGGEGCGKLRSRNRDGHAFILHLRTTLGDTLRQ